MQQFRLLEPFLQTNSKRPGRGPVQLAGSHGQCGVLLPRGGTAGSCAGLVKLEVEEDEEEEKEQQQQQ